MPQFFKLLARDLRHYDFTYKEGLNVDVLPFFAAGECQPGGLYYTSLWHIPLWYEERWPLIADVEVPDDAQVYTEPCGTKWKADKIVLSNIRPLSEFFAALDEDTMCFLLGQCGRMLARVERQTEAMCYSAVYNHQDNLEFVHNQTEAVCLLAVQRNGWWLERVKHQTYPICLAAVKQMSCALQYVEKQTGDMCLYAVQQNGLALEFVHNQTEVICRVAVAAHPHALQFVKIPIDF